MGVSDDENGTMYRYTLLSHWTSVDNEFATVDQINLFNVNITLVCIYDILSIYKF